MKDQEIIKAIAELDGFTIKMREEGLTPHYFRDGGCYGEASMYDYLNSRDAIVPVIEKQNYTIKARIVRELCKALSPEVDWDNYGVSDRIILQEVQNLLLATPHQLSEALLRATGKWKD